MDHLQDINKTYLEHLKCTLYYAYLSFQAGTIFIIHGIFPNYLVTTGSNIINELNILLLNNKKT